MAENTGNDLNVSIGANDDGLKKGLNDAAKAIKNFENEAIKISARLKQNARESEALSIKIKNLNKDFKAGVITQKQYDKSLTSISKADIKLANESTRLSTRLDKVNASSKRLKGGFNNVGKGAANAVPAMTSFSQVIQDAPYGIQGVANNITQLTSQFGYLKNSTGSSTKALKSMLGTLTGPAGILLAVSVVTSLLVSYGDELLKTSTDAEKLTKKQEELSKALEDYEKNLNGVDKARLKGSKSAAKELTTLSLLKQQIDNTNLSNGKRFAAVSRLRDLYPNYLKGISDEKSLIGGLDSVYRTITQSILNKAKAQAAASLITETSKKELVLQLQLEQLQTKNKEEQLKIDGLVAKEGQRASNIFKQKVALQKQLNKDVEGEKDLQEKINEVRKESLRLSKEVSKYGGIAGGDGLTRGLQEGIKSSLQGIDESVFAGSLPTLPSIFPTADKQEEEKQQYFDYLNTVKDGLTTFSEEANNIINTGVVTGFSSMAESIGQALASGDNAVQKGGAALLGSLGGVLVNYGKLVLAYGIATSAFAAAVKNPFGGGIAAIAAGAALIAIGGAVKGFASKASSGGGSTGNVGGSGSTSNSTSSSSSGNSYNNSSSSLQNVVFEIQGTKLVGVLSNTLARNKSLSGTLSIN